MNLYRGRGRKGNSYSSRKFLFKKTLNSFSRSLHNSVAHFESRSRLLRSNNSFHSTSSDINGSVTSNSYHYKRNRLRARSAGFSYICLSRITSKILRYIRLRGFSRTSRRVVLSSTKNNESTPSFRVTKEIREPKFHQRQKRRGVFSRGGSVYRSASTRKGK